MQPDGRLKRVAPHERQENSAVVYAGAAILDPVIFQDAPEGPFSLNILFDAAIAAGRLFGMKMDGSTGSRSEPPTPIPLAERAVAADTRRLKDVTADAFRASCRSRPAHPSCRHWPMRCWRARSSRNSHGMAHR